MIYAYWAVGLTFSIVFWRYVADFDESPGNDAFLGLLIAALWPLVIFGLAIGGFWALFVITVSKMSVRK